MENVKEVQNMDIMESKIYEIICSADGIKAKDIAKQLDEPRGTVNHYLYSAPYMRELCYQDNEYRWHGLIRQSVPHQGLEEFGGYYGWVEEFLDLDIHEFMELLKEGCQRIGRNLNDTRGLFHSFEDTYYAMQMLFGDLQQQGIDASAWDGWEILFELRIKRAKTIRIYADVILIADNKVFSLEFKMKDKVLEEDVRQTAKYCKYLEVLFGSEYDVVPALVLTGCADIYREENIPHSTAVVPVCSGDMLHYFVAEYLWQGKGGMKDGFL